jgi:Mrp family chromosome partitioning ATPase
LDSSVLLIDADLPKPHISTLFDAQDEKGLTNFLEGDISDPSEIILQTSADGLSILPAGNSREHATELLSGKRMAELIDTVHRRDPRTLILIDSSPLLQTTESRALAAICGQVVLVVRAGVTPKGAVMDAVSLLDTDKPSNLVLNQVRFGRGAGYYSSYYGGQYGSGNGGNDVRQKEGS